MKSIEQVLGYTYLTGIIKTVQTGIPDVLPSAFFTLTKETLKDSGRYTQYAGTRRVARRVEYGAPAVKRELKEIEVRDVKLAHFREHIDLDPLLYQALRGYDTYNVQEGATQEVERQVGNLKTIFDNNRVACVYSMLAKGAIYWNGSGQLLNTSSGAAVTVDYGIPAANKNQLGGIIATTWSNTAADIPGHLRNLRKQARRDHGYPLKYAFYGVNVPTYFAQNAQVQAYLSRNPATHQKFLDTGEIPDGLFGFTWVPMGEGAFFEDDSGTIQELWDGDQVTFTPDITSEHYELLEGTYMVPTSFNPYDTAQGALGSMQMVRGLFSYAIPIHNPVTAQVFYGDTFLPVWKIINTMYIADTTF